MDLLEQRPRGKNKVVGTGTVDAPEKIDDIAPQHRTLVGRVQHLLNRRVVAKRARHALVTRSRAGDLLLLLVAHPLISFQQVDYLAPQIFAPSKPQLPQMLRENDFRLCEGGGLIVSKVAS
jgi:hypothetical protein